MTSIMTITVFILLVSLYITTSAAVGRESGGREQRDIKRWQDVGNGVQNHQTSLENSITRRNVNSTLELWRIPFTNYDGAPFPPAVDGQPVYYDGMAYFVDSLGRFYSVYGNNGTIQWVTNTSRGNTVGTINSYRRTPYVDDIRICCAAREVVCVRRSNGAIIWRNNNSDDTTSVGPDGRLTDYYTQASDVGVVDGRLIVGRSSTQNGITQDQLLNSTNRDLTAKGGVSCFNLETGAVLWRLNTTSDQTQRNPQYGAGGGVYSSPGFDLFSQTVFLGSGQSYEPPASPLTDSLLAIDYVTGRLKWSYQFRAGDVWGRLYPDGPDRDVNTHPNVFEVVAKRASDTVPRIYRLVGVGSKDGIYVLFETVQDNPSNPEVISFINVDTGSNLGGFQSTPAIHGGILYTATLSGVSSNGTRISFNSSNLFSTSTKWSAYDIQALLEGRPANLWNNIEPVGFLNIPFGGLTYSEGIIFSTSFNGKLRGFNSTDGSEIFRRIPVPGGFMVFPGFSADTPLHGGVSVVDGKILIGFGSSFSINVIGGVVTYGFPFKREQRYDTVVPPAGSPGCTLGYQRCLADGSGFQTCAYTGQGTNTDFGASQSCAPGTTCRSFNGNYVNCN